MAIIGAIIGDIIGSQYEFESIDTHYNWEKCNLFSDRCMFTDDTVMTLAIKYAIDNNISYEHAMRKVGREYPSCGYGGMFYEWLFAHNPKPYGSYGNGSAMKVSYIGEYYKELEQVKYEAIKSASVTHNHPEGIKGAVVIATCVWMAKHKKTKQEIYDYVLLEYPMNTYKYSGLSIDELEICYKEDISCMTSIPAAARCFYESSSYISFIRNTFRFMNDTDTFCSMFGGVAEEYYGKTGLTNETILKKYLDDRLYNIYKGGVNCVR